MTERREKMRGPAANEGVQHQKGYPAERAEGRKNDSPDQHRGQQPNSCGDKRERQACRTMKERETQ